MDGSVWTLVYCESGKGREDGSIPGVSEYARPISGVSIGSSGLAVSIAGDSRAPDCMA